MSFIAGRHNGKRVYTGLHVLSAKRYSHHKYNGDGSPYQVGPMFTALIDTGATSTLISPRVADHLGDRPVTQNQYETGAGSIWLFAYLFYVGFKAQEYDTNSGENENFTVNIASTYVSGGCLDRSLGFDVLLGMDILRTGTLTVTSSTYKFEF